MSINDKSHQFTHSNTTRGASVVYDAAGKGGLFHPSDFIKPKPDNEIDDESSVSSATEYEPLLPYHSQSSRGYDVLRRGSVRSELLDTERDLLIRHNIAVGDDEQSIVEAFESAVLSKRLEQTTWQIELAALFKACVPLVVTFLLQNSLSTVTVFTVGHLGATELAAVSLGTMTANISGYSTIQGLATALDTLCPQAFGAKKYTLVGIYIQKCTALIAIVLIPIMTVWVFFGYQIISLVVPDKDTAKLAADYLKYIAPGIPAYIVFECGKRFLQAQGIYHISTYVLIFAAPSNLIMNIILVSKIGYLGAPIAVSINYWLMAIGLVISTFFLVDRESTPTGIHPLECWGGLNVREAFRGWGKLLNLAIPGFVMLEAEFLAFEILTLLASYLGTVILAVQAIGITIATLNYQIPFAIGIASSTRIANYLGAGLGSAAKVSTKISLSFGLFMSILNFLALCFFQNQIAQLFTNDEEVITTLRNVMWLVALLHIPDALNAYSAGCLRGQGQTKIGGIANLVSYYALGIPLSIYLSFYSKWKGSIDGLWIGSIVALALIGFVQSYYVLFADFDKLCDRARKNTSEDVSH